MFACIEVPALTGIIFPRSFYHRRPPCSDFERSMTVQVGETLRVPPSLLWLFVKTTHTDKAYRCLPFFPYIYVRIQDLNSVPIVGRYNIYIYFIRYFDHNLFRLLTNRFFLYLSFTECNEINLTKCARHLSIPFKEKLNESPILQPDIQL